MGKIIKRKVAKKNVLASKDVKKFQKKVSRERWHEGLDSKDIIRIHRYLKSGFLQSWVWLETNSLIVEDWTAFPSHYYVIPIVSPPESIEE